MPPLPNPSSTGGQISGEMDGSGNSSPPNPANPEASLPSDSILAERLFSVSAPPAARNPFNPPARSGVYGRGTLTGPRGGRGSAARGSQGAGRGLPSTRHGRQAPGQEQAALGAGRGSQEMAGRGLSGAGRGRQAPGQGMVGLGSSPGSQEMAGMGSGLGNQEDLVCTRGKKRAAGKKIDSDTGDAIDWNDTNTTLICGFFAKQVLKGNRPNTHMNSVGYDEVSEDFFQQIGIRLSKRQMRNKWDKLKPDYSAWKQLMRKQTGPGWDRTRGVIDMDDEWWKKAKADIPGCGKFRKKPLQNEDDLSVMFGDIINDQSDHWNPMSTNPIIPPSQEVPEDYDNGYINDVPDDCDNDAGGGDEIDDIQEISPSPTILLTNKRNAPKKKPRIGTALVIQEQITKIADTASSFVSKKMEEVTVEQVMEHVIECGAALDTDEHFIATELFVKKDQRKMFMTLPTNESRFNWLRRKYVAKYGN